MTAFDTDVLSDAANSVSAVAIRMAAVPAADRAVPIVVAEEALRGRLDVIRKAQAGGKISLEASYQYFADTLVQIRSMPLLPYTAAAHSLFVAWRAAKIRVSTQDLRIAAICIAHDAKLVTRNARDYAQVPGLTFDVWA